jgi:hypothetical protein
MTLDLDPADLSRAVGRRVATYDVTILATKTRALVHAVALGEWALESSP